MSKRIKKLMEERSITMEQIAKETMINIDKLKKIINEPHEGDVTSVKLIALVLDVSIDDLIDDNEFKRKEELDDECRN
ncbi:MULTISPECIES: helix-turn-helix domain-containing protein [Bacillus]|uniref:helix-turn-helix domain-containing protein n=1 Tax=Bacillus TaxID=1386 RepID=UPI001CD1A38F|nr:helix-turn-helix transcriptional regulator [Bacillus amyloliquefaciens]